MATDSVDRMVDASAEKRFFIEMLVKDIELLPAIMDLVDNSVDGARGMHPDGDLSEQWVRLTVGPESCVIADNSGGIDIDIARHYAFRFGRPREFKGIRRSVGQFGIGMKRAMFKIGRQFRVESAFAGRKGRPGSYFVLDVDVDAWEQDPAWAFELEEAAEGHVLADGEVAGTTISISKPHPSIADDLRSPLVLSMLRNELRVRHQQSIQAGLRIDFNGEALTAAHPVLQNSDMMAPINRTFTISTPTGDVEVRLVAGTVAARRRRTDQSDEVDEGRAENFQEPGEAGWYLFCNDRLLLAAERSALTGWGDPAAAYHPQYRRFRGYVYLTADDAALLPWNTTKTTVDRDSPVFRQVQSEMKRALVEVQAAINRAKNEAEGAQYDESAPKPLADALATAPEVSIFKLPVSASLRLPSPPPTPPRVRPTSTEQKIQYTVSRQDFDDAREVLGVNAAAEVGRRTFEYFLDNEVRS